MLNEDHQRSVNLWRNVFETPTGEYSGFLWLVRLKLNDLFTDFILLETDSKEEPGKKNMKYLSKNTAMEIMRVRP